MPETAPSKEPGRWSWLQRYRVWSANRKSFEYPENELEPEKPAQRRKRVKRRP
jgi:hypothetical protein